EGCSDEIDVRVNCKNPENPRTQAFYRLRDVPMKFYTPVKWQHSIDMLVTLKSPEPPGSVTIQPHRCKRMVTVSWTHHTCAHNFTVYFYTGDTVTNKETTRDHHITYGNTPRSMNFRVGVVARNDYGTSAEAISAEFRTPGCCDVF
ncbi:hypothetical protein CLF_111565, partial [Clonorchis sinensis]